MKILSKISWISYFLPLVTLAQTSKGTVQTGFPSAPVTNLQGIADLLCTIGLWMFNILIFVAILFAFYAAFVYLTARGDAEKIKSANHTLIYIAVAVMVALVARFVPSIVVSAVSNSTIAAGCNQ